jgi:hypothetical protein
VKPREPWVPLWVDAFRALLALLVINLLWNEPIGPATGGGPMPLLLLNVMPSAGALFLIFRGSLRREVPTDAQMRARALLRWEGEGGALGRGAAPGDALDEAPEFRRDAGH